MCFFLDLLGAIFPGPAPRCRCFFSATHVPSSALLAPSRSPAAFSLCAVRSLPVLVGVYPPLPLPLCFLPCGTLFPARTHEITAHVFGSRFLSVPAFCPFAILWLAPWRSPAMPGERPSLAAPSWQSLSSLPSLLPVSRPPPYCCSPAPCALRWSSPRQGCISRAPIG